MTRPTTKPMDMSMLLRILICALILFMAWMSLRAGWAMITGSEAMVKFFEPFGTAPVLRQLLGVIGSIGCLMMFHPKTFVWGSWLNMGVVMFLLVQFIHLRDAMAFVKEVWVIALGFVILWLGHPLEEKAT
ncbi:MAG: hypothetical protein JNM91_00270 [Flavobacteriales bacterium]|nr:hypothetical protein [Flavobacteriales bacterium]